jgi:hypothetical protein
MTPSNPVQNTEAASRDEGESTTAFTLRRIRAEIEAPLLKRIQELEANEKAYEEIIGKKTYREAAEAISSLKGHVQVLTTALEVIEGAPFSMVNDSESLRHTIKGLQATARFALHPKDPTP